jgi:hypothetical protein
MIIWSNLVTPMFTQRISCRWWSKFKSIGQIISKKLDLGTSRRQKILFNLISSISLRFNKEVYYPEKAMDDIRSNFWFRKGNKKNYLKIIQIVIRMIIAFIWSKYINNTFKSKIYLQILNLNYQLSKRDLSKLN